MSRQHWDSFYDEDFSGAEESQDESLSDDDHQAPRGFLLFI